MTELRLQDLIMKTLGSRPDIRLFRNNVGSLPLPNGGRLTYGLHKGSSDLIGWKTVTITPEMVGQEVAIFVGIEVKGLRTRITKEQKNWMDMVNAFGGIAGIVRSEEEAWELLLKEKV